MNSLPSSMCKVSTFRPVSLSTKLMTVRAFCRTSSAVLVFVYSVHDLRESSSIIAIQYREPPLLIALYSKVSRCSVFPGLDDPSSTLASLFGVAWDLVVLQISQFLQSSSSRFGALVLPSPLTIGHFESSIALIQAYPTCPSLSYCSCSVNRATS